MCRVSLLWLVMLSSADKRCRLVSHTDCCCGVGVEIYECILRDGTVVQQPVLSEGEISFLTNCAVLGGAVRESCVGQLD